MIPSALLSPVATRLQELLCVLQENMPVFSQRLGCPEDVLTTYLAHPTGAKMEFLAMVLTKVDGLQADWLLAGRGPMFRLSPFAPPTGPAHQEGNDGNVVGSNYGTILHITASECKDQLKLAMQLIEQQQQRLDDKDRIIQLLEALNPKP